MKPVVAKASCDILPWRGTGFWELTSIEGLYDDHCAAAFWAMPVGGQLIGFGAWFFVLRLIKFQLGVEQAPDLFDLVSANAVGQEARMADAMEA